MTRIHNRVEQKGTRRRLRREAPKAERLLWNRLRAGQMDGLKFRRQHGIGSYIADFYCAKAQLVVELDGDSHIGEVVHSEDLKRQAFIEAQGIQVLRFANQEVHQRMESVLQTIANVIMDCASVVHGESQRNNPPQSPLSKGGR